MNFVRDYENVFIKVKEWGRFDDSNIERNGLHSHRCGTQPPEFVAEFERKLVSKPCVAADVCCFLDYSFYAGALTGQCRRIRCIGT